LKEGWTFRKKRKKITRGRGDRGVRARPNAPKKLAKSFREGAAKNS